MPKIERLDNLLVSEFAAGTYRLGFQVRFLAPDSIQRKKGYDETRKSPTKLNNAIVNNAG
jgi:hypothetical protein